MYTQFDKADCDVLLLYDCGHSVQLADALAGKGMVEIIAAYQLERKTPASANFARRSFTSTLVQELTCAAQAGERLPMVELHQRLLYRSQFLNSSTHIGNDSNEQIGEQSKPPGSTEPQTMGGVPRLPSHHFIIPAGAKPRTITLVPLPPRTPSLLKQQPDVVDSPTLPTPAHQIPSSNTASAPSTPNTSDASQTHTPATTPNTPNSDTLDPQAGDTLALLDPQVLLCARLHVQSSESSSHLVNPEKWNEWLISLPEPARDDIALVGTYPGLTQQQVLLLIRVPVAVWDMLLPAAGFNNWISFVGFVTPDGRRAKGSSGGGISKMKTTALGKTGLNLPNAPASWRPTPSTGKMPEWPEIFTLGQPSAYADENRAHHLRMQEQGSMESRAQWGVQESPWRQLLDGMLEEEEQDAPKRYLSDAIREFCGPVQIIGRGFLGGDDDHKDRRLIAMVGRTVSSGLHCGVGGTEYLTESELLQGLVMMPVSLLLGALPSLCWWQYRVWILIRLEYRRISGF